MSSMSSMSLMSSFNAKVIVSEQMERLMSLAAQELAINAISACAEQYSFDASEAIRLLGLVSVKVCRNKEAKVEAVKASFPLPYSGECNDAQCHGLRQNNSLYTQCQVARKDNNDFCKSCQSSSDKNSGTPEYGTIEQRQAVGILEYVDPKGRKPIAYTKIMKKFKVTQEQVLEEARKMSMNLDVIHFAEPVEDGKRGRPSSKKEKEVKEPKGAKGRPKKTKKVLEIECDEEDLFASLVASANSDDSESEEEELVVKPVKKGKSDEEREAERLAKEEQRLAKEAKIASEKEEKAAKLASEKEEKAAKLASEKEEKAAKIASEKAEKEAKLAAEKAEKEAKLAAEKEAKAAKEVQRLKEKDAAKANKSKKPAAKIEVEVEADEEPDVVKKIEIDGKKYLKSKKTGIIYDYKEYTTNGEQVVVGKWNESKNKIDFTESAEESEEEYEEED